MNRLERWRDERFEFLRGNPDVGFVIRVLELLVLVYGLTFNSAMVEFLLAVTMITVADFFAPLIWKRVIHMRELSGSVEISGSLRKRFAKSLKANILPEGKLQPTKVPGELIIDGYRATIRNVPGENRWKGWVSNADASIQFEAWSPAAVEPSFRSALNVYRDQCRERGELPAEPQMTKEPVEDVGELDGDAVLALYHRYSVYPHIPVEPPTVLKRMAYSVADRLASEGLKSGNALSSVRFELGSNLYRRLGDLDMYHHTIEQALATPNKLNAAAVVASFLVGYFGAAKAVTDASAITLNELYALGLRAQSQDLSAKQFWERFEKRESAVFERYHQFRSLAEEVKKWRDAGVHRRTPLVIASGDPNGDEPMDVQLFDDPRATFRDILTGGSATTSWTDPLRYPRAWRPRFVGLYEAVANDLGR